MVMENIHRDQGSKNFLVEILKNLVNSFLKIGKYVFFILLNYLVIILILKRD